MKNYMMMVLGLGMVFGSTMAGPLPKTSAWAAARSDEQVREELKRMLIVEAKDQDRILAGWDEKTVVDVALELDALQVVHRVAARDGLSDVSVGRVLEHERAKVRPSNQI